jgi:hypothetical protein
MDSASTNQSTSRKVWFSVCSVFGPKRGNRRSRCSKRLPMSRSISVSFSVAANGPTSCCQERMVLAQIPERRRRGQDERGHPPRVVLTARAVSVSNQIVERLGPGDVWRYCRCVESPEKAALINPHVWFTDVGGLVLVSNAHGMNPQEQCLLDALLR